MKTTVYAFLLLALVSISLGCQSASELEKHVDPAVAPSPGPGKVSAPAAFGVKNPLSCALLIGISDYGNADGVPSLKGPVNDVNLVASLLAGRFEIDTRRTEILRDQEATHTRIRAAFRHLAEYTPACDFVYIHYAGHGSEYRLKDDTEDHPTWVSYGARNKQFQGDDFSDIESVEIAQWLAPLKTKNIVFVSDSCHSQSASRGDSNGIRGVPGIVRTASTTPDANHHIAVRDFGFFVGAAREDQFASEFDVQTGKGCRQSSPTCQGVFTWYWAKALSKSQPGDTWQEVFNRMAVLANADSASKQLPQSEGDGQFTVFGGRFVAVPPTVTVTRVSPDGVDIDRGELAGVTKGSLYQLRASGQGTDASAVPTLKIDQVSAYRAHGAMVTGTLAVQDLLVESVHSFETPPIRVHIDGEGRNDADQATLKALNGMLRTQAGFELVTDLADADWSVHLLHESASQQEPGLGSPLPDDVVGGVPTLWVVDARARLVSPFLRLPVCDAEDSVAVLGRNLTAWKRSREVLRKSEHGGNPQVSVKVEIWQVTSSCTMVGPWDCTQPQWATAGALYRHRGPYPATAVQPPPAHNDYVTFSLTNGDDSTDWNTYLLSLGPDAAVVRLFPRTTSTQGTALLQHGGGTPAPDNMPYRYWFNAIGTESFLLITSREPVQTEALSVTGMLKVDPSCKATTDTAVTRGALVEDIASRGAVGDWQTAAFSFEITPLADPGSTQASLPQPSKP